MAILFVTVLSTEAVGADAANTVPVIAGNVNWAFPAAVSGVKDIEPEELTSVRVPIISSLND